MSDARRARCWDLVLLGCGKSKRDEPARARDLYTGPVFRAHRAALAGSPSDWAFGPPMQPSVLVLAGAPYIDGWADRARAAGVRVDDPLRGYDLVERRMFARRFVAETEAWKVGEGDARGWSRREQLQDFVDAFELERAPSMDELEADDAQLGLSFWGEAHV